MLRCLECDNKQKEENKFHCKKCNGYKMEWITQTELSGFIRELILLQERVRKNETII